MENLKAPLDKKGRKLEALTKVQRFYSEFNSDISSSSSSLSSNSNENVFTFDNKRIQNSSVYDKLSHKAKETTIGSDMSPKAVDKKKIAAADTLIPSLSPGLSSNQDLKDKALDIIYQKKIKELKSNILS